MHKSYCLFVVFGFRLRLVKLASKWDFAYDGDGVRVAKII